ncbi:hypothetical protein V6N13_087574 [Hibiscus sabdariffa]
MAASHDKEEIVVVVPATKLRLMDDMAGNEKWVLDEKIPGVGNTHAFPQEFGWFRKELDGGNKCGSWILG